MDDNQAGTAETGFRERVLESALRLASVGYKVFPCKPWEKVPATRRGFHDASNDLDQVRKWFDNDAGFNLAIATGDGLLVVDVDPKNGGAETWEVLCAHHGTPLAPRHETPSGGFHLFFNAPGLTNSSGRIGKGIDTRGDGGYVVVPPSRLRDDDGVIIRYRWSKATALVSNDPTLLPNWVRTLLEAEPPVVRRSPDFVMTEWSPADALRARWDWYVELPRDGWQQERSSGGDVHWVRPGKSVRDGKSATLHASGAFVVWTSERPQGGLGTRGADGATFSPYDYVVAYRFGGDDRAAVAWIKREFGPDPTPQRVGAPTPVPEVTVPVLPAEFWSLRPVLGEIRDAARAQMASPDGLLVALLSRWAAMVPPNFKLPAVIGTLATFDFIGCIVAETSGGKGIATGVAAMLYDPDVDDVMLDYPLGSGEGLVQSFFVPDVDEETGKPNGKQKVGKRALHFDVDEAMSLIGQAGRSGTIIVPTLCSAWSGKTLGQANADASRRRIIPAGKVRISCCMNMQASNGWRLFEDDIRAMGFPGRILFASAHDPFGTADATWDGVIPFPLLPAQNLLPTVLSYDPAIVVEIKARRLGVLNGTVTIDAAKSQHLLLQCKVAGLFAIQDGRTDITLDDWSLAATLIDVSSRTLDHMSSIKAQHERDRSHSLGRAIAERELVAEDVKERQYVAKLATRIRDNCTAIPAPGKLARKLCSSDTRHRFDPALALAVQNGWVTVSDDTVTKL